MFKGVITDQIFEFRSEAAEAAVDGELGLSGPRPIAHGHKREGDDQRHQKPHGVDADLITAVLRRSFRAAAATTSHASHAAHGD